MVHPIPELSNVQVLLKSDPGDELVKESDMQVVKTPFVVPELKKGQVLLKNLFISLDPYMRGRMRTKQKNYFEPFAIGKVLQAGGIGEVIASSRDGFVEGDKVLAFVGWESYTVVSEAVPIQKLNVPNGIPLSYYLGILGMPGMTAYHGLLNLGELKEHDTVFVSGAAGAVGLVVGQIAKIKGATVIGSAGSDDKVELLKTRFNFDHAFNYKKASTYKEVSKAAPSGINVYFDNVGGQTLDEVLPLMKVHSRIVACGMISGYNGESYGYKNLFHVITKQIRMEGFIISEQVNDPVFRKKFFEDMFGWIAQNKLQYNETVVENLENAPEAFVGLFKGSNTGKLIIKI